MNSSRIFIWLISWSTNPHSNPQEKVLIFFCSYKKQCWDWILMLPERSRCDSPWSDFYGGFSAFLPSRIATFCCFQRSTNLFQRISRSHYASTSILSLSAIKTHLNSINQLHIIYMDLKGQCSYLIFFLEKSESCTRKQKESDSHTMKPLTPLNALQSKQFFMPKHEG